MSVDEPGVGELPDSTAPADAGAAGAAEAAEAIGQTRSQAALQRYGRRMRRARTIYFGAIAAGTLVLGIVVGIVWSHGETAHTSLKTAAHPAPSVALQPPSAGQQRAWQSADRTAIGTPYWGGTVVTYSTDSVRGRNAATGAITWSYTRTDRTVCQAIQDQGITVAIFEVNGNCDQVTGLDSGTGERRWARTLDKAEGQTGQPINGHPAYSVTQYAIMLTTAHVIYTIDPAGGLDRWVYHPEGCTIHSAVIGAEGALISQTCARPKCDGLKFCGAGPQLLLRDAGAGRSDDDKTNPDRIKWNLIGTSAVPASADRTVSGVTATGRLLVFDVAKGTTIASRELTGGVGGVASTDAITALQTERAEVLWVAGTAYSVDLADARIRWTVQTPAPPTAAPLSGTQLSPPDPRASALTVAGTNGIAVLDPDTGKATRAFAVAAPPPGSLVHPFGTGFIVAGPSTTVYR